MQTLTQFSAREELDISLATEISELLKDAIKRKGKASIDVSGGSTPKGFFAALSNISLDWSKVTITLADERWVAVDSSESNTRLVYENLIQNKAVEANFFHLRQDETLTPEVLKDLNIAAQSTLLPLDVLILGMGEDGHTASLFPCSEQIEECLQQNTEKSLLKVEPKTAPHQRITFSFSALAKSENVFLHICGENKKVVLNKALSNNDAFEMPIRAFLSHPKLNTKVYWAP